MVVDTDGGAEVTRRVGGVAKMAAVGLCWLAVVWDVWAFVAWVAGGEVQADAGRAAG